uniref:hypothetical protein n=1 Tax=Flavobacterium sp. TaxID=239 RepID=UPI004049FEF0
MEKFQTQIHKNVENLDATWDLLAQHSVFLQTKYLTFLAANTPQNMECFFVEIFHNQKLEGIALLQMIRLKKLDFLGIKASGFKKIVQECLIKQVVGTTLVVGNNMLSGQHAFYFSDNLPVEKGLEQLEIVTSSIIKEYKNQQENIRLITLKDFETDALNAIQNHLKANWFCFESQPNMVFFRKPKWQNFDDYLASLTKKYRDQYKRCRK